MRRSVGAGFAAFAVGALALAGCGGDDGGSSGADGAVAAPADVVVKGLDSLKFDQKEYAAKAGPVTIELVDDGNLPHTLLIEKVTSFKKLSVASKGKTSTGTVTLESGTYTIYCDVAGHRGAGMEATLVVS